MKSQMNDRTFTARLTALQDTVMDLSPERLGKVDISALQAEFHTLMVHCLMRKGRRARHYHYELYRVLCVMGAYANAVRVLAEIQCEFPHIVGTSGD